MKYKTVYQFRWILILAYITLIYFSNLILINLPFARMHFQPINAQTTFSSFLLNLFPRFSFEMQIYNIQTIVVWACGILFGPMFGAITVAIYILIGLAGLPVFAGGGGADYFKEATFGYLLSFPFNAYLSGMYFEKNKKILAVFLPILTTHLMGIIYLILFNRSLLDISWHLSFSMISYDIIFALILIPLMPFISFVLKEMISQEIPIRAQFEEEQYTPKIQRRKIKS